MVELPPAARAHLAEEFRRRMRSCVPWSRKIRWQPQLNIVATSYPTLNLFPELSPSTGPPGSLAEGEYVDSNRGSFRYLVRRHPAGKRLPTWWDKETGDVLFDGDIQIPMLFERRHSSGPEPVWREQPWMSLTPAELLTLRVGTKLARGKVVIGGLGLAHQLLEVAKRRAVEEIIVVERSHELCDLILPRVLPRISKKTTVMIGDAFKVLPTLTADVALVDVFPKYGPNYAATLELKRKCRKIGKLWGWGSVDPTSSRGARG